MEVSPPGSQRAPPHGCQRGGKLRSRSLRHLIIDGPVPEPEALKALAVWYRDYAERTDNPAVWHARLVIAELLKQKAIWLREQPHHAPPRGEPSSAAAVGNNDYVSE
jgi:hypothetical protein